MQIIVFAIFLAMASFYIEERYQKLLFYLFSAINEAMFHIAKWVINLTPIGVFSLISYIIAKQGNLIVNFKISGSYCHNWVFVWNSFITIGRSVNF